MRENVRPAVNPWIITVSVMLATFMEVLDTTVVNVSIPHISGNLGATYEEGTWVVTSYLVANAIVLPMAGWLANYFGRRRLLMACVAGFAASSLLCGAATSIDGLIFFRVLQGLSGGGMQPLSQAILLESFPKEKHGQAMAAYGLGIIFAPIVGPTLGGWITDNYTWRWIFYLNLPVGLLSLLMTARFVHDPSYIKRNEEGSVDLWGIGFLAVGLGTLQVILDTGQRKDWWGSRDIRILTLFCIVGLIAFTIRELIVRYPVVDLRALKDRAFGTGTVLMAMVGFSLYGSMVLIPNYLETLLGYPALQAGLAMSPRGIGSLFMMPLVGILSSRMDVRKLLVGGFGVGAWSMWALSRLNLNAGYWDIFWPQVFQGAAMACMFVPLANAAVSHISRERMGNATSIFNLMRNIGGSVGIALLTTILSRRQQMHINRLGEHITSGDIQTQEWLKQLTGYFRMQGSDPVTASKQAIGAIYANVQRHAAMLSFVECFFLMTVIFLALIPLVPLLHDPLKEHRKEVKEAEPTGRRSSAQEEREHEPALIHA